MGFRKTRYKFTQDAQIEIIEEVMTPLIEIEEKRQRYELERINANKKCNKKCTVLLEDNIGFITIHKYPNCLCFNQK